MSIQGRDVLSAIVLFLVLLLFPFLLNWILLRNAIVPVVGDSSSWLAFWSSYVGAILTALMVFATYLTIRKTINLNRAQWRIAWLSSFRAAATELLSAIDPTEVGQMAQDVIFWRFDQAAKKGHAMEIAVKRGSFLLTTALKEYDVVFDAHSGGKYIDELNSFISPFLQRTGEIIQFAIICNYLKEKTDTGKRADGIKTVFNMKDGMISKEYNVIAEALQNLYDKEPIDSVIHDTVVVLQKNLSSFDMDGFEKLLLRIGSKNVEKAYGMSLMVIGRRDEK